MVKVIIFKYFLCFLVVKLDTTGPTTPTEGTIGNVSGSNTIGIIQIPAGGSIDDGVGNVIYKYLINNTGETPEKTDERFTTSMEFIRSCDTSYHAWAIAEDSLGNRSEVKYLGTTNDKADSYSGWSTCSKTCGGGTQIRTNTCMLVTEGLSQSCNTKSCGWTTVYSVSTKTWISGYSFIRGDWIEDNGIYYEQGATANGTIRANWTNISKLKVKIQNHTEPVTFTLSYGSLKSSVSAEPTNGYFDIILNVSSLSGTKDITLTAKGNNGASFSTIHSCYVQ